VSAERKRVVSGATTEDEVIVIKNLAKVCMRCVIILEVPLWLEHRILKKRNLADIICEGRQ